jgi:membrane protein
MPLKDLSFLQIPFVQKVIAIIGGMIKRIAKNEIGIRAASIAYSGLFSIFPLLLFLVFLGSQFLESEEARTALNNTLSEVLPAASETVQQVVEQTIDARGSIGLIAGIGLLWSASTLFNQLTTSLNVVWNASPRPFWRRRLIALISVLTIAILFLLSITFSALAVIRFPGEGTVLSGWLNSSVGLAVTILLFWVMYHGIPNTPVKIWASFGGAMLSALLWQAAKGIFAWYLASGLNNYGAVYGSLASVIALVLWVYISALILFIGAEFGAALQRELVENNKDDVPQER